MNRRAVQIETMREQLPLGAHDMCQKCISGVSGDQMKEVTLACCGRRSNTAVVTIAALIAIAIGR